MNDSVLMEMAKDIREKNEVLELARANQNDVREAYQRACIALNKTNLDYAQGNRYVEVCEQDVKDALATMNRFTDDLTMNVDKQSRRD